MVKTPVTAVFDIGKTNKKFFLFDEDLKEVYQSYTRLEPIPDEDGFPSIPIHSLREWMLETFREALTFPEFEIIKLNFSGHGATFVHTDEFGEPVTHTYDYLKPFPEPLLNQFYEKYGGREAFSKQTASPPLGMLNSGLQLYFLKYAKPEMFQKIKFSMHLPQYLSFLFTGQMVSDFTSIGCHTGLWDFEKRDYHDWVKKEGVDNLFPPIKPSNEVLSTKPELGSVSCGVGVHDSSGALLPYLNAEKDPFILLSTGTWSISINPFNQLPLTEKELKKDCLQFLSISGNPIKISRLFIGEEHKYQIDQMYIHWDLSLETYKKLKFDPVIFEKVAKQPTKRIRFEFLKPKEFGIEMATKTDWSSFSDFTEAYHTLIHELTDLQVASLSLVLADLKIDRIFVDGGFNANELFVEMLRIKIPGKEIITSDFPNGSAMGAAILVNMETNTYSLS